MFKRRVLEANKKLNKDKILIEAAESTGRLLVGTEVNNAYDTSMILGELDEKYKQYLSEPKLIINKVQAIEFLKKTVQYALNKRPGDAEIIREIALEESLNGDPLPMLMGKWSIGDSDKKIAKFLRIYLNDQDLAKLIVKKNILGFHGTKSGALVSILNHGAILTAEEARSNGVELVTGERAYSPSGGQPTISFADWRNTDSIIEYTGEKAKNMSLDRLENDLVELKNQIESAKIHLSGKYLTNYLSACDDLEKKINFIKRNPKSLEAELMLLDFPIALAFGGDESDKHCESIYDVSNLTGDCVIDCAESDIVGEFLIKTKRLSLDRVPAIATTREHVAQLRKILDKFGYKNLEVIKLESLNR